MIVGGGAAGFFAALTVKKLAPQCQVTIIEKTAKPLAKVGISGGGRCNVTHACFDPRELIKNYPRGSKELLGPFHVFQPKDTIAWFESRGVALKTEADGRIFPISDSSDDIIQCLLKEAHKLGVSIQLQTPIESISQKEKCFQLTGKKGELVADAIVLATGNSSFGHAFAKNFGHTIQEPIPSLFTLNVPSFPLSDLAGISVPHATIYLKDSLLSQTGALLITHWGFSGPCALKLSAFGAKVLHERNYITNLSINWTGIKSEEEAQKILLDCRKAFSSQMIQNHPLFEIPKNLWIRLLERAGVTTSQRLGEMNNQLLFKIAKQLLNDHYKMEGKTTHKAEFVTCGGVALSEVNFKTMESKICPNLFFAGEILDIDGITGGFNFQNAWTGGYLAGCTLAERFL